SRQNAGFVSASMRRSPSCFGVAKDIAVLRLRGCCSIELWSCARGQVFGYPPQERIGADLHTKIARSRILIPQQVSEPGSDCGARELDGAFLAQNGLDGRRPEALINDGQWLAVSVTYDQESRGGCRPAATHGGTIGLDAHDVVGAALFRQSGFTAIVRV